MDLTPEQCAVIAQLSPVFMLVVFIERRALMRASSEPPSARQLRIMVGLLAVQVVQVAVCVRGINGGISGFFGIVPTLAFTLTLAGIVALFANVMQLDRQAQNRRLIEDEKTERLLRAERTLAEKIAESVKRDAAGRAPDGVSSHAR